MEKKPIHYVCALGHNGADTLMERKTMKPTITWTTWGAWRKRFDIAMRIKNENARNLWIRALWDVATGN